MSTNEHIEVLCNSVKEAISCKQALNIQGGSSKSFYGNSCRGKNLDVTQNQGIVDYEPSELFITAKNATPLEEIEHVLYLSNQMLAFEPPKFDAAATLGGTIACGLSGPRRPYSGAMRDSILGTQIINGKGELLNFGGNVMKNVAGYDVSRLMCGAFGTLGIITQVSLKVIPKHQCEITLAHECSEEQALQKMNDWLSSQLPITATYYENNILYTRVSGLEKSTHKIQSSLGGDLITDDTFWSSVKEHERKFFKDDLPLWRMIIPHNQAKLNFSGQCALEWNGGLRWLKSDEDPEIIYNQVKAMGGYATLFNSNTKPNDCLPQMDAKLKALHIKLKQSFDPHNILNIGRMYSWC